ncbi:MAG TPA: sugar phosphate isomerase/epimerase [Abditibacteriaceae bacterium]|jgi:sugar phosphate isomerase/epimerase
MSLQTQTGGFPIGFRRGWSDWQKDLPSLCAWATQNELGVIDLGADGAEAAPIAAAAGLQIGSVDALDWGALMSPDAGKRADAVARNAEYITACAGAGARNFFAVLLPEKPELPRKENFGYAVESLAALAPTFEQNNARLVLEGYPGAGALACTPETVRALLKEVPSQGIGLNYDPSHLWRMNIDALRFLREFASRVGHVHGKDTEILPDNVYEFGTEQSATFAKNPAFGGASWRYTIPGKGMTPWSEVFSILQEHGYNGAVSIELEDANYNGTTEGEHNGILEGARYLAQQ